MIEFKDPFQQETILTILPVPFNKTVHFAVNSKYKYVAVWDLKTAKDIHKNLQNAIEALENLDNDKKIKADAKINQQTNFTLDDEIPF